MARFLKDRHLLHALALTVSRRKQAEEAVQKTCEELSKAVGQLEQERIPMVMQIDEWQTLIKVED